MMEGVATLGLGHFWAQADALIRFTAYALLAMSVGSWFLILWKTWSWLRMRRAARQIDQFWSAHSLDEAIALLKPLDREGLFVPLAAGAAAALQAPSGEGTLAAQTDRSDLLTRALRQRINEAAARLESGLTFLASVGSTAPFIGLFGTVWGIMNSFTAIAGMQNTSLAVVAPGIAEALFATAIGLIAAIPATIAYNKFSSDFGRFAGRMEAFAAEFAAILSRQSEAAAEQPARPARSNAPVE
jgi:TolQ protein